jgi:monoamine oxidase
MAAQLLFGGALGPRALCKSQSHRRTFGARPSFNKAEQNSMHAPHSKSIAIIGAGASGLYLAYRLSQAGFDKVRLFEKRSRVGGRMHDRIIQGHNTPIALGALSFSDAHSLVRGLCAHLELPIGPLQVRRRGYALRGVRASGEDLSALKDAYDLAANPRDQGCAYEILFSVIGAMAPDFEAYWRDPDALLDYLDSCRPAGRGLRSWGFWNLIARYLAPDAYAFVRDCMGACSSVANTQAREAIFTLLWETRPNQRHFRLRGGFCALAHGLRQKIAQKARIILGAELQSVRARDAGVELCFSQANGARSSHVVDAAIITCPPAALERVAFDDAMIAACVRLGCARVREIDATKLFLGFSRPWWGPAAARTIDVLAADAPLRQVFMEDAASGVLLASFADGESASFWQGLCQASDAPASALAIEAAIAQLQRALGVTAPAPLSSWFVDWSRHGEGAAWHAWAIGADAHRVRAQMRQPAREIPVFICGEAFASPQGWVEGAISSAEMVLERHFGMARPAWVRGQFAFEV